MLSHFAVGRFSLQSFGLALLILCISCGFGLFSLSKPINTVHAATETVPHTAVYSINADGSGLQRLADDPQHALWGPT